ncbi:ATP-binding protein [Haliangium ochraceum]|uniref:Rad50/SbcC-type AAA domain-containing protein n=1 Tax=Haliangium ochraceum (strain DSM 14365 / JCM 11303 / SMP-2) TaxID=502025 RepID=D0LXX7_HALO1|nr:ATP-binding protein [Haliangium ochraceum]ACY14332.1 hypothetical protein Hoch_1783 [Haliangium ochraceum DSM 14365]
MQIEVENLRGFRRAALSFAAAPEPDAGARPLTVLLGGAGSGKSTLLQALALGLMPRREAAALLAHQPGPWVRLGARARGAQSHPEARIRVELADPAQPQRRFSVTTHIADSDGDAGSATTAGGPAAGPTLRQETEPRTGFPWHRVRVSGYGAVRVPPAPAQTTNARGRASAAKPPRARARDAVATLFDPRARLLPASALFADAAADAAAQRLRLCKSILGIRGSLNGNDLGLVQKRASGSIPLSALGGGVSDIAAWLVDLVARAHAGAPRGLLLVDAVDAQLQPAGQRDLLARVRARCPELQVVVSARSPGAIANRAAAELALCTRRGQQLAVSQDLPPPAGHDADALLRGPWFGLPATTDDATAVRLSDYREGVRAGAAADDRARLREAVRARVGYFVATPLDELAGEVLAAFEAEHTAAESEDERARIRERAAEALRRRLGDAET